MPPLVTLTTDFGTNGSYVAEMKGAGLEVCPDLQYVDVTHEVPPQDVRYGAFILRQVVPFYPPGTVHVVVVDPGVGTTRRILCFRARDQFLIGPDNGVLTWAVRRLGGAIECRVVQNRSWWRQTISATFHGRDIMVPVAARIARGDPWARVGCATDRWVELPWPEPAKHQAELRGEVLFVDPFGNLITNIPQRWLVNQPSQVAIKGMTARWVRTYGNARPGELVSLVGSSELLEIAVVQGSAAERLDAGPGTPVTVKLAELD